MTLAQYLERYHEEGEVVRRTLATLLGRQAEGDVAEAKAVLDRWDARVDQMWASVETPA